MTERDTKRFNKRVNIVYKNEPEQERKEILLSKGFKAIKRGWPDFMFFKGNKFYCVEVKPTDQEKLSPFQVRVMDFLESKGVVCYKYSCDEGFVRWTKEKSTQEKKHRTTYSKELLKYLYSDEEIEALYPKKKKRQKRPQ